MGFFRFVRLAAFVAVVSCVLLGVSTRAAEAQSLSLSTIGVSRQQPFRSDPVNRFKISRADCLANDVLSFPLIVGNYGGYTLEVWATQSTSDNCREDTARTTATATCWRVFSSTPTSTTPTVSIRVQDIAARPSSTEGTNVGTAASCDSTASTGQPVTLYFMFLRGSTQSGDVAQWPTTVDLLGPSSPVVEGLGAGGGLLKLSWKQNADTDVFGYRVFCENLGSAGGGFVVYDAETPIPGSPKATCPDASSSGGTTNDAGDDIDGGDEDAGAVMDACIPGSSSSTDGSTGGTSGCGSALAAGTTLTPEQITQYACGSTGVSGTSATVTGLTNFQRYAVAVAAFDLVENVGPLSLVQCSTPQPVNGFDEAYRSAGGTAGGASFCSVGLRSVPARSTVGPAAAFLAIVTLGQWRRQRRGRASESHLSVRG